MIAKHVSMRAVQKSDFAALVAYLTDSQSKQERVGEVTATNCRSHDTESACLEILNTQALNKRARSDKTYHLVISFDASDMLDAHELRTIEQRLCESLGFSEHQRVSVVHHDTDNLHVHVAINKIHPNRYTIHNPHADFKTLGDACAILERAFDLAVTNHQANKVVSENLAADMERHAGVESLLGWIKRECGSQILATKTWDELHLVLQDHGLALRERGNGFVFQSRDGTMVKASGVDRAFSKIRLQAKLGAFEPSTETEWTARRSYSKKPLTSGAVPDRLFALYQAEQWQRKAAHASEYKSLSAQRDRLIKAAKRSCALKRAALKFVGGLPIVKKIGYCLITGSMQQELAKIRTECIQKRAALQKKYKRCSWADWLRQRAEEKDEEALQVLRRHSCCKTERNAIGGKGKAAAKKYFDGWDSVTKQGNIILGVCGTSVRDDGTRLRVSRDATPEGLQAVLRLAIERYGEHIHVEGTSDFKRCVVRTAAEEGIRVRFDSPDLEALHHVLTRKTKMADGSEDKAHTIGALIEPSLSLPHAHGVERASIAKDKTETKTADRSKSRGSHRL